MSSTISRSLLKLMSIESVMPSNHLILCHPLLLPPSIFPSIRVFSSEWTLCIGWPKYWSFSFSITLSKEHSGLISFRIDWFDLAVQGTLKSLLQHHSSKASILWCSAFFMVQLSHPYMTTGKTIALTRWTFFGKVMSLLFNILSRFAIAFLPRNKCLLTVRSDFGVQENTVCHCFHCFSIYLLIIYFIIRMACLHAYNKVYFYWNSWWTCLLRQRIQNEVKKDPEESTQADAHSVSSYHIWEPVSYSLLLLLTANWKIIKQCTNISDI